jgi:hypothetical protein
MTLWRNISGIAKLKWYGIVQCVGLFCLSALALAALPGIAAGQTDPDESAPPPVRAISRDEGIRLNRENDVKARTLVALDLMNARVTAAEKAAGLEDFEKMYTELGGFLGILDNTIDFLLRSDSNNDKVLSNFKRFEIGLRGYVPKIELIRRELPLRYEPFVKSTIKYIRDARSRALEPLFGDTVVREPRRN